jgi:metal-sulfur cluster biosynthetic enzyme
MSSPEFMSSDFPAEGIKFDGDMADLPQIAIVRGAPLAPGAKPLVDKEPIVEAIKLVFDPDVDVNLYDLGLIYNIDLKPNGDADIDMTLTSPTCPMAEEMVANVAEFASSVEGVGRASVRLVWSPAWTISMMSDAARYELGLA